MTYWNLPGLLLAVGFWVVTQPVLAQKTAFSRAYTQRSAPMSGSLAAPKINYYQSEQRVSTHVPAPAGFLKQRSSTGRLAAPTAQFIVTYTNFTPAAQQAFQYAV